MVKKRKIQLGGLLEFGHETSVGIFAIVFSFLLTGQSYVLRIELRRQCKTFREAIPAAISGIYTTFPHPKFSSFKEFLDRLNILFKTNPASAPKYLFIGEGHHKVELYPDDDGDACNSVNVLFPLTFLGEGSNKTTVQAGFDIRGEKKDQVLFKDLTIDSATFSGMFGNRGSSFKAESCSINCSGASGVICWGTKGTLCNCEIKDNGLHGIWSWCHGTLNIEGENTKITNNCKKVCKQGTHKHFGMYSCCATSLISLKLPLTKETISVNNQGGGNWGGNGSIEEVEEFEKTCTCGTKEDEDDDDDDDMPELEEDDAEDDTGIPELDQPLQFHLELDANAGDNDDDMPELEVLEDDDDGDDVLETVD